MTISAGIDYSMSSPAITIYNDTKPFHIDNCKIFYLTGHKKCLNKRADWLGTLLPKTESFKSVEERFDYIAQWALNAVQKNNVWKVFLEGYSFSSKGSSIFQIGENTGNLKNSLWRAGIPFDTIPPKSVKLSFSGNGNASKILMEMKFLQETGIDIKKLLDMTEKQENPSSDIIDSYAILKCGLEMNNECQKS